MKIKKIWYNNGSVEIQKLSDDVIPEGFTKGRLPRPKKVDSLKNKISKHELYLYYIIQNHSFNDTFEHFDVDRNELRILISYYDIHKDPKMARKNNTYKRTHEQSVEIGKKSSITQKVNWANKSDEDKERWSIICHDAQINMDPETRKLHTEHMLSTMNSKSDEEKQAINNSRRYKCKEAWSNPELIAKRSETAKLNRQSRGKQLCRSNAEQLVYNTLIEIYPDVQYDVVVDERYPYYCDFYIPSLDLFIEYNGHPSHGTRPYNENDGISVEESYKLYGQWLDVYTQTDVAKYNTAKLNNLHYIMIYPSNTLEYNVGLNPPEYSSIVKIIYNSRKIPATK